MKQFETKGIILRRTDYGEADRIITLLTSDHGKIRVMAKGVRKQKSKLAGGIELFSISEIHYIKGRGDIDTLVSTRLIKHYGNIVRDLSRTEQAYNILKSSNKTIEDHAGSEYYPVLHESLAALDDVAIPIALIELSYAMRMLQLLGHVPQFSSDTSGNRLDPDGAFEFDFESVAFRPVENGPFDKNHIKLLKLLAYNSPGAVAQIQEVSRYIEALSPLVRGLRNQYVPS